MSIRRLFSFVALAALVREPAFAQQQSAVAMPATIVTAAQGEVMVAPDRATIVFAVETRATTAAASSADNARRSKAVLDTLKKLGLLDEQLRTEGYSVYPEQTYEQGKAPRIVAYVVRNAVRAEIRRIDQVGRAIDAALGAGSNQVSSLQFSSSRVDEVRRQAYADAVRKARADADAIASAAGGSVGGVVEITTGFESPRPIPMVAMARATAAEKVDTPITPGEQSVVANVTVRWLFVPR